jgi:hypothetical protein
VAADDPNIERIQFVTDEHALSYLKDRVDDIAQVAIPVGGPVTVLHKGQSLGPYYGIGMIVFMVSGDIHLFQPSRAELILNDGFLNRMRIKISLLEGNAERGGDRRQ